MEQMLNRKVRVEDVILAHPCKANTFIERAKQCRVDLMTFDNELELIKIHNIFSKARLVLRIKVDDKDSNVKLSSKFGADMAIIRRLLTKAQDLNLKVVGIAFHVGSSCQTTDSYEEAIKLSRTAYDMATRMGFKITLLDIGGGFSGSDVYYYKKLVDHVPTFTEFSGVVSKALDRYYPEENLTIIGEPGRYYCESAFTLYTKIISKSAIDHKNWKTVMYYLNDGIYGSFSDGLIDKRIFRPIPLLKSNEIKSRPSFRTILWGPTCDSADVVKKSFGMVEMNVGEWIKFEDMGAYSLPHCDVGFNGMLAPKQCVFVSEYASKNLKNIRFNLRETTNICIAQISKEE